MPMDADCEAHVSLPFDRYTRAIGRRIRSRLILFGTLRHTEPVLLAFGAGSGTPVDRHYIDQFLVDNADAISGRALEVGGSDYLDRFGHDISSIDILHRDADAPGATIAADLASCPHIPSGSFDCIVLTQTLHYVFDMKAALSELHRILAPGGTVLCTVPGISPVSRYDMDRWGDRWRLTSLSAQELFSTAFVPEDIIVKTYGNVLAALCFIEGIPADRLRQHELDAHDDDYQLIVAIRAKKSQ